MEDGAGLAQNEAQWQKSEEFGMAYALLVSFLTAGLIGVIHGSFVAVGAALILQLTPLLPATIFAFRPAAFSGVITGWALIVLVGSFLVTMLSRENAAYVLLYLFAWLPSMIIAPALAKVFIPMARLYSAWDVFSVACGITLATFFSLLAVFYLAMS